MKTGIHAIAVVSLLAVAMAARAQTAPAKPFNWLQQIGPVAADPEQVRAVMEQVDPAERAEFTRRLLRAIGSMPIPPEEKTRRLTRAAVLLVASSGDSRRDVVGSIFAHCPLLQLGAVSQALAAGFDQKKNGLSDAAYLTIATNLMAAVVEQVSAGSRAFVGTGLSDDTQSDDLVRLTVAAATFVRAAADPAAVEAALLAYIPTANRPLVLRVLPAAIKGDYGPLMDMVGSEVRMVLPVVFGPSVAPYALLSQLDIRRSADESIFVSVGIERQWGNRRPLLLLPLPVGYQNQGIRDRIFGEDGFIDNVSERIADSEILYRLRTLPDFGCGVPGLGCLLPGFGCGLPGGGCGGLPGGGCGAPIGGCGEPVAGGK